MSKLEDYLKDYAQHRQRANTYRTLARESEFAAKQIEDRIHRSIAVKPLTKREKTQLITLIETGEIEYVQEANDNLDVEPF